MGLRRCSVRAMQVRWSALLDAGADPMAQDNLGGSPLAGFAGNGNMAGVQLLLDAGAEVDARDDFSGTTALMDAAETGSTACVEVLLRAGADPSVALDGKTASALAARQGHHALAALPRRRGDTRLRHRVDQQSDVALTSQACRRRSRRTRAVAWAEPCAGSMPVAPATPQELEPVRGSTRPAFESTELS